MTETIDALLDAALLCGSVTVLLACLAALLHFGRYELSLRVAAAMLLAVWATLLIGRALGAWADAYAITDHIGVSGAALWATHLWRAARRTHWCRGVPRRRSDDWAHTLPPNKHGCVGGGRK